MDTGMEVIIFLAYASGLLIIFFLSNLFVFSGRLLVKIVMNSLCGGIVLAVINIVGGEFGIHLPLNFLTCFAVGALGIPGIALLCFLC